jgi:hypothetical protein
MGYHKKEIEKGVFGEFSKIKEEFDELTDAYEQKDKILQLVELGDLIGAIEEYSLKHFNITLDDIISFSNKTKSAFIEKKR